ncbi:MAG: prolyl oligopeptidase family serine peptidase [Pseudomonadota bacterium]|nr:prolyl oligopeptidase family serine peptidase [Pseudomonadota bacterium]
MHPLILPLLGGCAFGLGAQTVAVDGDATSRCEVTEETVTCEHDTVVFHAGLAARDVHVQHPVGEPPSEGWPVVLMFQGSFDVRGVWEGAEGDVFGGLHQAAVTAALLDAGFAVLAPEARYGGASYWDTNVLPWAHAWFASADHRLVLGLLRAIDAGDLGPLDPDRLYATGISSGGYMTSRMAVAYPGRFRALAIASASYATCAGPLCAVPALPDDHPPTLFLHGGADSIVPITTMEAYADALAADGVPTERVTDPDEGHAWLAIAPDEVVEWFSAW